MNHTRRGLLRAGVGSVVLASAGCVGILDDDSSDDGEEADDGGDGNDGDGTPAAAPSATFDFEEHDEELVITHDGGDALDSDSVTIQGPVGDWISTGQSVASGDRITLVKSSSAGSGDSVEIVWRDPSGDGEAVIGEYTLSG